jgi:hypothetical protein
MKTFFALSLLITCTSTAYAQTYYRQPSSAYGTGSNPSSEGVSGYTRQNGTYVQPYQRSAPDNTQYDNYSARGNVNPYTGQAGTKTPKY